MVAAPSSTASINPQAFAPMISDEVRQQLALERKRLAADPGRNQLPVEMQFSAKHVYRAKPGTYRRILHQLPMPPEESAAGDEKKFQFALRRWKATVAQAWYPTMEREAAAKKLTAHLEKVRDALGDTGFKFTHVPRHQECYFVTNDDVIAGYIDELIARRIGEFAQVYKEHKVRIVVGFGTEQAKAFPNTEMGSRLARAYAAEHGLTDMKFVAEDQKE